MWKVLFFAIISTGNVISELVQVHVVFRHGARFPIKFTTYPNDGYKFLTYEPYGYGALTSKGVKQAVHLGQELRKRYNDLLGEYYNSSRIALWSTPVDRTINTALSMYAGMWPPKSNDMNWQPTPIRTLEKDHSVLSTPKTCYYLKMEIDSVPKDPKFLSLLEPHKNDIDYIARFAGYKNMTYMHLFLLHQQLESYCLLGLYLPMWAKSVFPEKTTFLAGFFYIANTFTPELKREAGGHLLKKIIDNSRGIIENNLASKQVYFYSGHEYNIAYLLISLNVFDPQLPSYTSFVSVELHKQFDDYFFKILYQNYTSEAPYVLTIPGCDEMCPYDQFVKLLASNIPYSGTYCPDL